MQGSHLVLSRSSVLFGFLLLDYRYRLLAVSCNFLGVELSELLRFVVLADRDPVLQEAIRSSSCPDEIVALAELRGYHFAVQSLREVSRDLSAAYWPWAAKGHQWRRAWFAIY